MVEDAEVLEPDEWSKAEQLRDLARNGERDTIQFEKLQDEEVADALRDIEQSEPERLGGRME